MLCPNKDVWGLNLIAFINALFFMTVTLPIWGILAAVLVVIALCFGFLVVLLKVCFLLFSIVFFLPLRQINASVDEILSRFFLSVLGDFISTLQGLELGNRSSRLDVGFAR